MQDRKSLLRGLSVFTHCGTVHRLLAPGTAGDSVISCPSSSGVCICQCKGSPKPQIGARRPKTWNVPSGCQRLADPCRYFLLANRPRDRGPRDCKLPQSLASARRELAVQGDGSLRNSKVDFARMKSCPWTARRTTIPFRSILAIFPFHWETEERLPSFSENFKPTTHFATFLFQV